MRKQFEAEVMKQDYPEFRFVLDLAFPEESTPQMHILMRNNQKVVYEFENLDIFDIILKHINFLETTADRKQYLERHKDVWWRFETAEETAHAQVMVDARETDENKDEVN